jgi:membrane-associated phospholipid phosphatase
MRTLTLTSSRVTRYWPIVSAAAALVLAVAIGLVVLFREQNKPFGFELEWMGEMVEHRSTWLTNLALVFNALGGGILAIALIPIGTTLALFLTRHRWSALYFLIATILSAGTVQLLKQLFGRPRPTDMLVHPDFGSFPSGHSANAALIAAALGIIFRKTWIWAAGAVYAVAMMLSRTYLGAHWISDTVGGLLIGAGVAVIVAAPFARALRSEREARTASPDDTPT